jgi:hypothetical protein
MSDFPSRAPATIAVDRNEDAKATVSSNLNKSPRTGHNSLKQDTLKSVDFGDSAESPTQQCTTSSFNGEARQVKIAVGR